VYFYAAAKKCEATEDRQFAQHNKAMSASLKKSMEDAWIQLANLYLIRAQKERSTGRQQVT
jgi:hypothetical protein